MPPKKTKESVKGKRLIDATSCSSPPPTAKPPISSPQIQSRSGPPCTDAQRSQAMFDSNEEASKIGTDAPKTPEKIASDDDGESPFRTLRQELGLSRIVIPALRPRRNTDPFVFRLRPDIVRNEVNLQAAINEIIYNEDRVQTFMRLSLTPAEATSVRDLQAAQVLAQFTDETLTLRDALWYLEYANWDVELAILQQMHDHIDRNEAPKAGSIQILADFPEENPNLDRDPAIAGDAFDESKFKLHYVQYGVARTRTYPLWQTVDRNNINDVRALNSWRWKTIMEQVGLKNLSKSKMKGWTYSKLELIWIRNYERDHPDPVGRNITEAFNATFAGAMLPGETEPRGERSAAAIASIRRRIAEAREKKEEMGKGRKRTALEAELGSVEGEGYGNGGGEDGSKEIGTKENGGEMENEKDDEAEAEAEAEEAQERKKQKEDEADGLGGGDAQH